MRQKANPPWLALGMSRATWYRLGKPQTKPPQRMTQAQLAKLYQISLRRLQRSCRIMREGPDLAAQLEDGSLKTGTAERLLIERQEAAMLAWLKANGIVPADRLTLNPRAEGKSR
jgi:hypothetical protein